MDKGKLAAGIAVGIVLGALIFGGLGLAPMGGFGHVLLWPLFAVVGLVMAVLGVGLGLLFAAVPLLIIAAIVVLVVKLFDGGRQRPTQAAPDEVRVDGP